MQDTEFEEKRAIKRIPTQLSLRFLVAHSNKESLAQIQDMSANGMGLLTEEELPRYTPLELQLEIPDKGELLCIKAEVVWSCMIEANRYRIGIRLQKMDLVDLLDFLRVLRVV